MLHKLLYFDQRLQILAHINNANQRSTLTVQAGFSDTKLIRPDRPRQKELVDRLSDVQKYSV